MKKEWLNVKSLTVAGTIASVYVVVSMLLQPLSFGPFQVRAAEALTLMPILFPQAVPALFVGCILTNLFSMYGLPDIVFGSLATLLAAYLTRKFRRNQLLASLPPILINAVVVGVLIHVQAGEPLMFTMFTVGLGQAISVLVIGFAVMYALRRANVHNLA